MWISNLWMEIFPKLTKKKGSELDKKRSNLDKKKGSDLDKSFLSITSDQSIEYWLIRNQPYIVFHHYFHFFSLMLSIFFLSLLFPSLSFLRYGYKKGFDCFNFLPYPSAPTFLGILGTASFIKMTWALRLIWRLWVTSKRPTFNRSWSGGTSSLLLILFHLSYLKAVWRMSRSSWW